MQKSSVKNWEHRTVEVRILPDSQNVMFFDHYAKQYREQKSDLDHYLAKLHADGWKQIMGLWPFQANPNIKIYVFKRLIK
jgi:hypothetical protein